MPARDQPALPGRQAEARLNDGIVLRAAREVVDEFGADAPVSEIARRAGVGVGTLYRRYPSKEDLFRRLCRDSMETAVADAAAALEAADAWEGFASFVHRSLTAGMGGLAHLAGRYELTPDMVELGEQVRSSIQAVADRAHAEGPLRPGVSAADVCLLVQTLSDVGRRARIEVDAERYLAVVLAGLVGNEPLPGSAVRWRSGADLWGISDAARASG